MKELMSIARNVYFGNESEPDQLDGFIEVVLTVSEPQFRMDQGGELSRVRVPETIRFTATPKGLRALSERLAEFAEEAEIEAGKFERNCRLRGDSRRTEKADCETGRET